MLTCISGFWQVKNKHDNRYLQWFHNTLSIQCPYIIFGNKESLEIIKKFRPVSLPTHYIELDIENFVTYPFKERMKSFPVDCPSVELNLIWNEKIFLMEKAKELNPFQTDYFAWIDAGIANYRQQPPPNKPFPNTDKLLILPKDKVIFNSTKREPFDNTLIEKPVYDSPNYHYFAGTAFVMHQEIVSKMAVLYKDKMEQIVNTQNIYTDQVIWTHLLNDHPDMFLSAGFNYGNIVPILY